MGQLQLTNVINISVSQAQAGVGDYNTSNLAVFSDETPEGSFGDEGFKQFIDPTDVATDFGSDSITYQMALAVFSQQPNILTGSGQLVVILLEPSETLAAAITRTKDLVQYFGVLITQTLTDYGQVKLLAAAAVLQALVKIGFFVSYDADDIDEGGALDLLRSGNLSHSRGLYYGDDDNAGLQAMLYAAAYAGRALSVNFSGSNTTSTMNLKDLTTIQPDPSMTQTLYNKAEAAGVDLYTSLQGVPKVVCFGANSFFDQVYNLLWFVGALQVAGFNFLAQAATKIPQTESGMDGLKGAYRNVCEQAVTCQYSAPGSWTSPTVFGVPADLIANIAQRGYYIYSGPISKQSQTNRAARKAPLVQIALKEAGALHKSDVIVNVNA